MYKGYFNFLVDGTVGEGDVHSLAPDSDLLRVIYLLYMYMTMSSCSKDGWPVSSCSLWQNGRCCMLFCSISFCLYTVDTCNSRHCANAIRLLTIDYNIILIVHADY